MAQDLTTKRIHVAEKAVTACQNIVDALNVLLELKDERSKFAQDFQDGDFLRDNLMHITPGMIGTLFDFVVPSLQTNYTDTDNGGRNKQILLQMRG